MPLVAKRWTRDEVLALPYDGNRYELIDGELLVTPSPRPLHQVAVWELNKLISAYVDAHRIGITGLAPVDLDLHSGQVSQPDLFVAAVDLGRVPRTWEEFPIPMLVVEVLSPSTARYDRLTKRRRYQASGVDCYWIVDLDARLIEEWRPGAEQPAILDRIAEWRPDPSVPPLVISVQEVLTRILGR